ncbi:hypothetical protein EVAR_18157_1 [Eumeta japonica]|uniref:Uncharacterized protein n=1 Tax=Eumeta variegata TaxID=151549 RepID=A0A4C1UV94_EUMVA|nr:hypothetical protein EVAR_18157_1 [Eumeta japonica]
MRSLPSMCGVSRKDRCRNSGDRERCGSKEDVVTRVERGVVIKSAAVQSEKEDQHGAGAPDARITKAAAVIKRLCKQNVNSSISAAAARAQARPSSFVTQMFPPGRSVKSARIRANRPLPG